MSAERWRAGDIHGNYPNRIYNADTNEAVGEAYWPATTAHDDHPAAFAEENRRARLMAAGPQMLEVLSQCEATLRAFDIRNSSWNFTELTGACAEAIAAAKGGE